MEIIFHSHANKTHFHKKGCATSLILKVRVFGIVFLTGQSWRVIKSLYTSRGPEQGFWRCSSDGLNQSLVSPVAQARASLQPLTFSIKLFATLIYHSVEHDNFGFSAGWFLDKVSETEYTFFTPSFSLLTL